MSPTNKTCKSETCSQQRHSKSSLFRFLVVGKRLFLLFLDWRDLTAILLLQVMLTDYNLDVRKYCEQAKRTPCLCCFSRGLGPSVCASKGGLEWLLTPDARCQRPTFRIPLAL